MSADGTIDAAWMARVKEVVDYAYDAGLYVVLNVHHDDALWLVPTNDKLEGIRQRSQHLETDLHHIPGL